MWWADRRMANGARTRGRAGSGRGGSGQPTAAGTQARAGNGRGGSGQPTAAGTRGRARNARGGSGQPTAAGTRGRAGTWMSERCGRGTQPSGARGDAVSCQRRFAASAYRVNAAVPRRRIVSKPLCRVGVSCQSRCAASAYRVNAAVPPWRVVSTPLCRLRAIAHPRDGPPPPIPPSHPDGFRTPGLRWRCAGRISANSSWSAAGRGRWSWSGCAYGRCSAWR